MKFFSTKQISEKWGISQRRVGLLASQGRIEGARQMDGRWLIPENAVKPEDPRKAGSPKPEPPSRRYVFPFVLSTVHSEEQIESFTEEEHELYHLCLTFEEGNFAECRKISEHLLGSDNLYIRLGALYHLPMTCMYLRDFEAANRYSVFFRTELCGATEHKAELSMLLDCFDSEMVSVLDYPRQIETIDADSLPDELLPFLSGVKLLGELLSFGLSGRMPDFSPYTIICRQVEEDGYFFSAMYLHAILSVCYSIAGEREKECTHLRSALNIALEHRVFFSLASCMLANTETAKVILREFPAEMQERFPFLASVFVKARADYRNYLGVAGTLPQLTGDEYRLIYCCLKNRSVEQMAETFGLSKSGMNRRLASLYGKLGVKSKKDMISTYLKYAAEWGK